MITTPMSNPDTDSKFSIIIANSYLATTNFTLTPWSMYNTDPKNDEQQTE